MKRAIAFVIPAALTIAILTATGCTKQARAEQADEPSVDRGRYLVEQASMCGDCHTPRREDGSFDETRRLHGAEIDFAPIVPVPAWATVAPPLAGGCVMGWSRDQLITYLQTGTTPEGIPAARPPMPPYRFSRTDAESIVLYLETLQGP